jgi:hypothetical protein
VLMAQDRRTSASARAQSCNSSEWSLGRHEAAASAENIASRACRRTDRAELLRLQSKTKGYIVDFADCNRGMRGIKHEAVCVSSLQLSVRSQG